MTEWQTADNRITRPSQWSDLLITDSGSSISFHCQQTTKNSGDGRMRRPSARVTLFGTQDDANMPQQMWRVRLQIAQRRANDLSAVRWSMESYIAAIIQGSMAEACTSLDVHGWRARCNVPGPSTVAALSTEAPNDSDTCYREQIFVSNSNSLYCCVFLIVFRISTHLILQ